MFIPVHGVLSNAIKGFGYENGILRVVLKNGKAYDYRGVTEEDLAAFSQGLGKAYSKHITGKYKGEPVNDTDYTSL